MTRSPRMLTVLLLCSTPTTAFAADAWSEPRPGMRQLVRSTPEPWQIRALVVDLCAPGVSLRVTQSGERQRTVSSFAELVGADAAINGDFFYNTFATHGMSVGSGALWPDTQDKDYSSFIAFGDDRITHKFPGWVTVSEPWMEQLISGFRALVADGVPMGLDGSDLCTDRHPRTAAGFTRDGRGLVLAVVDGRTEISVGMTCPELGGLMAELGAWNAVLLDGGGSTTMWVRDQGVINAPSDGAQRVVANHLGVYASGGGEPRSCERAWEEATAHGDAYDASTSTDVDGDGDGDVCARTPAGFVCGLADGGVFSTTIAGPALTDANGWGDPNNWTTLRMGDIDGDRRADLCAREDAGVRCWRATGAGFEADGVVGPAMPDDQGWADPVFHGGLRFADIDADGKDDLCARSSSDYRCWPSLGDGFGEPWLLPDLSDAAGFRSHGLHGTIRLGDIDGDGRADVCARTIDGMRCWPSTGAGFGAVIEGPAWSDANGWWLTRYWSTIRLVDLDGDRRADLCARSSAGITCHLAQDGGFGPEIVGPPLSDATGWGDYDNYSTLRFADIDGDGTQDLCARANAEVVCYPFTGSGFGEAIVGPPLSDANGWSEARYYTTIRLVDTDADGRADLCARGSAGLSCWRSLGDGFGPEVTAPLFTDAEGFSAPSHFETIHGVPPRLRCVPETCNGEDDDCDGAVDEDCPVDSGETGVTGVTGETGETGVTGGGGTTDVVVPTGGEPNDGSSGTTSSGEQADGGGCACTSGGDAGSPWWGLVFVPVLARRRRRPDLTVVGPACPGRHGA